MDQDDKKAMIRNMAFQVVLILIVVVSFLATQGVPQRLYAKLQNRPPNPRVALTEVEKAILLDPKDAASHLLKSMALDLQGFRSNALETLYAGLSHLVAASLAAEERGDALFKRVELKISLSQRKHVDSTMTVLKTETVEPLQPLQPRRCLPSLENAVVGERRRGRKCASAFASPPPQRAQPEHNNPHASTLGFPSSAYNFSSLRAHGSLQKAYSRASSLSPFYKGLQGGRKTIRPLKQSKDLKTLSLQSVIRSKNALMFRSTKWLKGLKALSLQCTTRLKSALMLKTSKCHKS
ncbi:hypothetical protein Fmac_018361 [Flemingia macrophylla]|uniref:Uncharacterized protein n=1 Tax=Flemingia macrophylla TaxID=520843 RepID=A0ABD1M4R6_9FABA